ncbi:protein phosphatase 2C domain-containing protein [Streptomyces sp. NBC_00572]|uniref:protein phosphatase 2C domain-containing protein n=1 Tax=Streptomyces sp. NBC_00572 TaxID=2903664 RepID=UPI002258CBF3|nr:protein phosphatase 2C domain-containing protein [Streptomyces sp. NBC_00572]MCX4983441.1 protein phosphatase 2C domain-containing protein [Streptomyces sp. NBC_00572]
MRSDVASLPGSPERPNEDWVAAALPASGSGGTVALLDGVTPPAGDDGCVHTVPWFTARLGGALTELSVSRRDMTLSEILSLAIRRTADAHRDTCDLSHARTPQATVVLARWDETSVEHLVLSDSVLLLESPDGAVRAVLDDRLDHVPDEILRSLAATDRLRNQEGGFFTAAADPAVAERAVTGTSPRAEVRSLAALTDGASRWVELFAMGDWTDCFGVLREEGALGLLRRVRALEEADRAAGGTRRWKPHDDATAVLVELRDR